MEDRLSIGVATRLSRYLQVASWAAEDGTALISSHQIAFYTGINSTQVRRDLSAFGKFGRRGFGYETDLLRRLLEKLLGAEAKRAIVVVGAGRVGRAVVRSGLLAKHGLEISAIFDSDEETVGSEVGKLTVCPVGELVERVRELGAVGAVIAVPSRAAQDVADSLIGAGVRAILNYSEAPLEVPSSVSVQTMSPAVAFLSMLHLQAV